MSSAEIEYSPENDPILQEARVFLEDTGYGDISDKTVEYKGRVMTVAQGLANNLSAAYEMSPEVFEAYMSGVKLAIDQQDHSSNS